MTEGERGRHGDQPADGDHSGDAANQQPVGGTEWLLQQLGGGRLKNFFDQTSTGVQQRLTEENAEAEGSEAASTTESTEGAADAPADTAADGAPESPDARTPVPSDSESVAAAAAAATSTPAPSWASTAPRTPAADADSSASASGLETDSGSAESAAPDAQAASDGGDISRSGDPEQIDWARTTRDGAGDDAPDWASKNDALASDQAITRAAADAPAPSSASSIAGGAADDDDDSAAPDWASATRGSAQDSPWWLASGAAAAQPDDTDNAGTDASVAESAESDVHSAQADTSAEAEAEAEAEAGADAGAEADAGAAHAHEHGVHARDTAPVDPYSEAPAATGALDPLTAPRTDARREADSAPSTDDPERVYAWPSEDDPWKEGPVWPDDEAAPAEPDEIGSGFSWNLRPSDDVDPLVAARDAGAVGEDTAADDLAAADDDADDTSADDTSADDTAADDAADVVEAEIVEDDQPVAAEADTHFLAIPVSDLGADDSDAREIDDVATEFIPARSAFDTQLQEQFDEEAVTQAHPIPEGFDAAPAAAHINHGSTASAATTAAAAAAAGAPAEAKTARSATGAAYGDRDGSGGDGGTGPSWVVPSARPAGPPRGLVIAAVVVAAIVVFGALFFLGTRIGMASQSAAPATSETPVASTEPSASAEPTPVLPTVGPLPAGTYDWNQLLGGECIDPFTDQWAESFTVVDCGAPHAAQLVKTASVSDDPAATLPAEADLAAQVSGFCQAPGVIDVTAAAAIGDVQVRTSYPLTQEQWDAGQRSYYCFLDRASAEPITGTLAPAAG